MAFEKNKGYLRREAAIDDTSFRLLAVSLIAAILLLSVFSAYLTIFMINKGTDSPVIGDKNQFGEGDFPFRVDGINIELPSTQDAEFVIPEDSIKSKYAILADVTDSKIIASRQGEIMIYPASMTKVMTLIVVAENLKSNNALDEVLEIKHEYGENSGLGYKVGTKLTVKDLLHAAILQSDGIACMTLAEYIAGSEAGFVKLMNEKAVEMGIGNSTLFQNCTGLHHVYHYSTCRDIAIIMAYAMKNPLCSSVLTAQKYESESASLFYNRLFTKNYLYTSQPKKAEILAGKTGLTEKDTSGYCIVTYARGDNGHFYVSVTAKAESWSANVQDILNTYNEYVK